jgi:hypothetical protein
LSIAWATVALLVLLLPGFMFIARLYYVERTARESTASPIAFLAGAIPAAFLIQVTAYSLLRSRIDLRAVLATLQLEGSQQVPLSDLSAILRASSWWILAYVLVTAGLGWCLGWLLSVLIKAGYLPIFIRHGMARDLLMTAEPVWRTLLLESPAGRFLKSRMKTKMPVRWAYVVSNVSHAGRILMYKGILKHNYFTQDGKISYVVLDNCHRCYLDLNDVEAPKTTSAGAIQIGKNVAEGNRPVAGLLMIHGSEISNIFFEWFATPFSADSMDLVKSARESLRKDISGVHKAVAQPGSS